MKSIDGSDPFTSEIIRNGLAYAALEMSKGMKHAAHHPQLYEVQDFGVAIVSVDGELWGEAAGINIFLGSSAETIKNAVRFHGLNGFRGGDVFITNDPYTTGTHTSDVAVYAPILADGELFAFAISTAHWADIGGKAPGGWCPDSTDVYQEGVILTNQRLFSAGHREVGLWRLIDDNVRYPSIVRGDLDAQVACCQIGAKRVLALVGRYGVRRLKEAMDQAMERAEAKIRDEIRRLPDGAYSATIRLDSDGVSEGVRPQVGVTVHVSGERLTVDFRGSSEAARGPVNLPAIGTKATARVALKALLMPQGTGNEGHLRAFEFILPPGLVVSPERPQPCDSYGYIMAAVSECIFQALAQVVPERCPAGGFNLLASFVSRTDPRYGPPFMIMDPVFGGNGASANGDGATLMRFVDGNCQNTPVEVLEMRFPLLCERYALRPEVAGAGRHRGGFGVIRDLRMLEDGMMLQTAHENNIDPMGKGLVGGLDGAPCEVIITAGSEQRLAPGRVGNLGPFSAGDVISLRGGGGGGYGPPEERDPELVATEIDDGLLTADKAAEIYRVKVIVPKDDVARCSVDLAATNALRGTQNLVGVVHGNKRSRRDKDAAGLNQQGRTE